MKYVAIYSDDALSHHGVKGQKWGVRRYQNPDGSLTPEGRDHYGIDSKKYFTPNVKQTAARSARRSAIDGAIGTGVIGTVATAAAAAMAPQYAIPVGLAWLASTAGTSATSAVWGGIAGARAGHKQDKFIREAVDSGRAFTVSNLTLSRRVIRI